MNRLKFTIRYFVIYLVLLTFLTVSATGQGASEIDSLFESYPKTKVLVLGTFHFKDAGLDSYKPQHDLDIKSDERQEELDLVLKKIEAFGPQAIGLEYNPEHEEKFNRRYEQYLAGEFELPANEIYQMGFRLAERLDHEQLFGIDADRRRYADIAALDQEAYQALQKKYVDSILALAPDSKHWNPVFTEYYSFKDKLKMEVPLIEYFRYLNDPALVSRGHGHYLIDSFKFGMGVEGDYFGPDAVTSWYNRNLRILQNIYTMIERSDADRILVIIGAGHLPILLHAIEASPELELVPVSKVLD
ncbi:MAG: DUF5694 domain-containing protein [Saprospiraceae bacterium]|nr:DUF5694 domain-containing protein [Saprospiraceae bacterium]